MSLAKTKCKDTPVNNQVSRPEGRGRNTGYTYAHYHPGPQMEVRQRVLGTETELKNKNQLDATCHFIVLLIGSTCFEHYYAHHRELATMMLVTTLVVSFCKDEGVSVTVNVWFLVVCLGSMSSPLCV